MKTNDVVAGILLLQQYREKADGYDLGAEHDVIYASPTTRKLSIGDVEKMIKLGWHQDNVELSGEDFAAVDYDPEERWATYV